MSEHQIQVSMSKKGDFYDNAMIESFWATLKKECAEKTIFSSRDEAKRVIFEYIEVYYHRKRRHSSLGYMSPFDYEKQEKRQMVIFLDEDLVFMVIYMYTYYVYIYGEMIVFISFDASPLTHFLRLSPPKKRVNSSCTPNEIFGKLQG
jgi:Transposase and inactivated derivatives